MRSCSIVVVVLFAGVALCGRASAEVGVPAGTVQQSAADALFLQYAPAPPTRGSCAWWTREWTPIRTPPRSWPAAMRFRRTRTPEMNSPP